MKSRHVRAPNVDDALAPKRRKDVKVECVAIGVFRLALAFCRDMQPHEILGDLSKGANRPRLPPLFNGVGALLNLPEKNLRLRSGLFSRQAAVIPYGHTSRSADPADLDHVDFRAGWRLATVLLFRREGANPEALEIGVP